MKGSKNDHLKLIFNSLATDNNDYTGGIEIATRVSKFERNIIRAFKGSTEDFSDGKIESKDDFLASIYHHLRPYIDQNKRNTMLINHSVGDCRPDISIFKDDDYLVAIELITVTRVGGEIRSYDPSLVKSSMEKLKLCASNYQRGYLIHIDENDRGYKDGFAQWKDDYYRNLWHEVEGSKTFVFEVKKGRTNKRGV